MILAKTKKLSKQTILLAASLLLAVPLLYGPAPFANAASLSSRNVIIGNSTVSAVTSNQFNFSIPSFSNLGSIEFEYCENNPFPGTPCTPPAGGNVSGAVLTDQSGETGFTIGSPTSPNRIVLTRTAVAASGVVSSYTFTNIINPSDPGKTVYVRISTFITEDATGSRTDDGAVVFATALNVSVNGFVPPYLTFCVGVTVELDCTSATGELLNFGELVTTTTRALTSQYSGATNDPGGFSTSVAGSTMTSGNNTIPALATPKPSQRGTSQFGMNLRANSSPGVGADPSGSGTSAPVSQLATPNQFYFASQVISNSPLPTDFNRFTASYIVNVASDQRPGIYSTTLTYIAVAAF